MKISMHKSEAARLKYFISYAQNYEDVMLHRALGHVERGFYIDVGAQDPETDSVTRAFYERGWRGINIEPVQHWFERLQEQRPHDINLQVAVSDHPGELKLYESDTSGLSTSDGAFAADARARGWNMREATVPCVTLEQICAEHSVHVVHFLKVDCEGAEEQALRGMPLDQVRPWIIVVEATEPNSARATHQQWESLLTDNQYEFAYFDGLNRYYVAQEHLELREAFTVPPHVFDWFKRAEEDRAQRRAEELDEELKAVRSVERIARIEAERDHWLRENERREVALEESRRLIATLQEQATVLRSEILRLQGDIATLGEQHGQECRSLRAEIEGYAEAGRGLQQEIARLRGNIAIEGERHARLRNEMKGQREELARLQQEWCENARERDQLLANLEQMRASHSWKLTAPLRGSVHAARAGLRGCKRGIKAVFRRPIRALRPLLKQLAFNPRAHRAAMTLLGGRNSALSRRLRTFLFGAAPIPTPQSIVRMGEELDPTVYSRRERVALTALQDALPPATSDKE